MGAQVIALGDGKFEVYLLKGGLPGAGWEPGMERTKLTGKREENEGLCFDASRNPVGKWNREQLKTTSPNGESLTLKRVERRSPSLDARAPANGVMLFDGTSTDEWFQGRIENGFLQATNAATKKRFGDYKLHLEFRTPYKPFARGQKRGNSGVYHSGRWETQILDSFGLEPKDNECGGIYSIARPRLNMCLTEYTNGLRGDSKERSRLYNDLLIGVTKFFRDFKSFQSLDSILRETITKRTAKGPFRVWVCACSTGEEAYSIGMMIDNILDELGISLEFKIFATDVDRHSLEIAAKGLYSKESLEVIRDSKYAGYFHETDDGFQVSTELRRSIVFAPHNALRDPPFTNLDLVSCRNFLIYLNPTAQKRVLSTLSFGLRPAGLLFLGSSENPSAVELSYQALHPSAKIYLKRDTIEQTGWSSVGFSPYAMQEPLLGDKSLKRVRTRKQTSEVVFDTNSLQDQVLSDALGTAVIINPLGFVVHSFGNVAPWISFQTGKASLAFSDLVEPTIRADAISCYMQAKLSGRSMRSIPYKPPNEQQPRLLTIQGSRYVGDNGESIVIVQFNLQSQTTAEESNIPLEDIPESITHHLRTLQAELSHTRESLHATIEELESSNEELQSTNEEMVASNEELQSTNEELHSVNEELYTVNAEYQKKITELSELNADFDNLLASTDIHTIFLDQSLTIRFFTPRAMELFSFAKSDVGRSIEVFKHFLKAPDLIPELRRVIETGVPIEREVASLEEQYFLMRLMPYRSSGRIAGVVVSLLDITARIEWDAKLKEVNQRFERAIVATRDGIWDWPDTSRGEMWWSPACYEILGYEVGEIPALYSTWMQLVHPDDQELIRLPTLPEQTTCFVDLHRDFEYPAL